MQTRQVVIRRGADVVGPDGVIGAVAHVVVDEATREVSELVVRGRDGGEFVMPASAIGGATEQAVILRSDSQSDLRPRAYADAPARTSDALELREEELHVRKQTRELGAVELRKQIIGERRGLDVAVWHEELIVERQRLDPPQATDAPIADETFLRVVLREEVPVADKRPVVTEAVRVGRRTLNETQQVDTTIRKEVADVRLSRSTPTEGLES